MRSLCPSQDDRNLRVELYQHQSCGEEVEISKRMNVKCYQCGEMVYRLTQGQRLISVSREV